MDGSSVVLFFINFMIEQGEGNMPKKKQYKEDRNYNPACISQLSLQLVQASIALSSGLSGVA